MGGGSLAQMLANVVWSGPDRCVRVGQKGVDFAQADGVAADERGMNVVQFSVEPLLRVAQAFPATPRIMVELERLLRDPDVELADVARPLKRDGALSARLLRVANSAAFAQSEQVGSIDNAAALIGLQEIHRVVGAVAVDEFSHGQYPLYGFSGDRFRENALLVALLMEELALPAQVESQAAYATGLFRALGKLALEKIADESEPVPAFAAEPDSDLVRWERHAFGVAANEATAIILQSWKFPRAIAVAIGEHFAPTGNDRRLSHLLNLAAGLADELGRGLPGEKPYWRGPDAGCRETGVAPRTLKRQVDRATAAFERLSGAIF